MLTRSARVAPDTVDDLTRRELITGITALGLLAACGANRTDPSPAPAAEGSFPVRIEHLHGSTEIPFEPERIVTLGLSDHDAVYAVGRQPVAATEWLQETVVFPWSAEVAPDADPEVLPFEINVEAVAALEPDLIIGVFADISSEQYRLLSNIAPTVAGHPDHPVYFTPWQDQARMIGRALGREEQAAEAVSDVERELTEAAARHPEWAGTSAVLASFYADGLLYVYQAGNSGSFILEQLGFEIPARLIEFQDDPKQIPGLPAEHFDVIDVDLIVWDSTREQLEASGILEVPTFQALRAVREGRMVVPEAALAAAFSYRTVLSIPWALERLEARIPLALDGDPSTVVPSS